MRKKLLFFIAFILFITIGSTVIYYYNNNFQIIKQNETEKIAIQINEAVEKEGTYFFKQNENYFDLFTKAKLLPFADIENINFEQKLINNQKIFIPYKKEKIIKINLHEIENANQLVKWGISSKNANKIFNYLKNNKSLNLKDIEKLEGVGKKSIEILKLFINQ